MLDDAPSASAPSWRGSPSIKAWLVRLVESCALLDVVPGGEVVWPEAAFDAINHPLRGKP
jgi:hypothetical protein